MLSGCLARLLGARTCIRSGAALLSRVGRRLGLLAALQDLQSKLELQDPLLLVVWSQLMGVSGQLLGAVPLQNTSKLGNFRLKLLVRLLLPDHIVDVVRRAVVVSAGEVIRRPCITPTLLALAVALSAAAGVAPRRRTGGGQLVRRIGAFPLLRRLILPLLFATLALPLVRILQLVCLVVLGGSDGRGTLRRRFSAVLLVGRAAVLVLLLHGSRC